MSISEDELRQQFQKVIGKLKAEVTDCLKDRYGCGFCVSKMEDDFDLRAEKLTIYPENDPALHFTAWINADRQITDDYIQQLNLKKLEAALTNALAAVGVTAAAKISIPDEIIRETDTSLSLGDFLKKHHPKSLLIRLLLEEASFDREKVVLTLGKAKEVYGPILYADCYSFASADFLKCREIVSAYARITTAMIQRYNVKTHFTAYIPAEGDADIMIQTPAAREGK